jgi:hypothetical protein
MDCGRGGGKWECAGNVAAATGSMLCTTRHGQLTDSCCEARRGQQFSSVLPLSHMNTRQLSTMVCTPEAHFWYFAHEVIRKQKPSII